MSFSNLYLNDDKDGTDFVSLGRRFHSRIVDGRNESKNDRDEA